MTKTMERVALPTIACYGNYSSGNYGAHCLCVTVGPVRVWYSYTTPVAFQVDGHDVSCASTRGSRRRVST